MCIPGIFNNGRFMNMAYDMIHGGLAGSMNLMFNQNIEHCMTFPTVYSMPNSIFNFSPYGTIGSNNYLLDPTFPIFQSQFGMGGNFGNFGNFGMPMMPWMNPEMMKKMWSFDGTDSTSSSTDSTTRKYNKMRSLLQNIANSDEVKQTVKDQINDAIRNCKGKTEEKLEKLTEIYEKLDKEVVKKALREANNIGYAKKSTSVKDSFRTNLEAIGFEYGNGDVDKTISKLYNDIKEIESNGSKTVPSVAGGVVNEDNILDFISSWNTKFADYDNDSDKRILSHIAEYYNSMNDGEGTVRSNLINPLVDALINKADDVSDDLPKSEKAKINKAVKELTNAWGNDDQISDDMIEAFDKLYVLVRMAALANFNEEVIGYYGELDEDLFNEELFTEETIKDLKAEGFSKSAIKDANEDVEVSNDDDDDADATSDADDDDDKTQTKTKTKPLTEDEKKLHDIGWGAMDALEGRTSDSEWADVRSRVLKVDSRTVLEFLNGAKRYAASDKWGNWFADCDDGFFEQSGHENREDSTIFALQKPLLEALLECAKENKNNKDLTENQRETLKKYEKEIDSALDSKSPVGAYMDNIANDMHSILDKVYEFKY